MNINGVVWAMQAPGFNGPHLLAVAGSRMLYKDPEGRWASLPCGRMETAHLMAMRKTTAMEVMGGVLVTNPVGFEVWQSSSADVRGLTQDIGDAAEEALSFFA